MRRMKKWQFITVIIMSIIVVLGAIALTVWAVVFRQSKIINDYDDITDYKPLKWYIGNTMPDGSKAADASQLFGGRGGENAEYTVADSTIIDIVGGKARIRQKGETKLTVTANNKSETYDIEVIDGVNAFRYIDLLDIAARKKTICQQSDIRLTDSINTPKNFKSVELKADYYGNGYKLISSKDVVNQYDGRLLSVQSENVAIQDLYIVGQEIANGEQFSLGDFGKAGMLISFDGNGSKKIGGSVINCVIENAQRGIFVNAADVLIKGNFIRNGADACISIESTNEDKTNVTLENNVIFNAVVAGVLSWCYTDGMRTENFANITINGFLDIYNWKDSNTAQIVPESEATSVLVNPILPTTLNKAEYDSFFYKKNAKKYVHCGIIVIATGNAQANGTAINGYEALNYEKRTFPLPDIANVGMHYCMVYGYGAGENPRIEPEANPLRTQNLFKDLREGRSK